jgi:hypothetical protein
LSSFCCPSSSPFRFFTKSQTRSADRYRLSQPNTNTNTNTNTATMACCDCDVVTCPNCTPRPTRDEKIRALASVIIMTFAVSRSQHELWCNCMIFAAIFGVVYFDLLEQNFFSFIANSDAAIESRWPVVVKNACILDQELGRLFYGFGMFVYWIVPIFGRVLLSFLHSRWALPEFDRDVMTEDAPTLSPLSWFDESETDTKTTISNSDSDSDHTTLEDDEEDLEIGVPGAIVKSPPQLPPQPTPQQSQPTNTSVAAAITTINHSCSNSNASLTSLSSGFLSDGTFEAAFKEECKRFEAAAAAKTTITTTDNSNSSSNSLEDDSSEISSIFDGIEIAPPTTKVGRNGRTWGLLWCETADRGCIVGMCRGGGVRSLCIGGCVRMEEQTGSRQYGRRRRGK